MTKFFKVFFTTVIRCDNNKFPNNSSLGMVSVFNYAILDLAVSNLTLVFSDLQTTSPKTTRTSKTMKILANNSILVIQTLKPLIDINIHKCFIFLKYRSYICLFKAFGNLSLNNSYWNYDAIYKSKCHSSLLIFLRMYHFVVKLFSS